MKIVIDTGQNYLNCENYLCGVKFINNCKKKKSIGKQRKKKYVKNNEV